MSLSVGRNISPWSLCAICLALILTLFVAHTVHGQDGSDDLEREAQAIDKMIMCPVCPAETIDQAQVEISFQMRAVIREMLAEGRTREDILDYFVDRYGADILAAPPKSGTNLLAWILPIVGAACGLVGVYLVIRAMTGRQRPATASAANVVSTERLTPDEPVDPDLVPYLEIADRLMASRRNLRPATPTASAAADGRDDGDGSGRRSAADGATDG